MILILRLILADTCVYAVTRSNELFVVYSAACVFTNGKPKLTGKKRIIWCKHFAFEVHLLFYLSNWTIEMETAAVELGSQPITTPSNRTLFATLNMSPMRQNSCGGERSYNDDLLLLGLGILLISVLILLFLIIWLLLKWKIIERF